MSRTTTSVRTPTGSWVAAWCNAKFSKVKVEEAGQTYGVGIVAPSRRPHRCFRDGRRERLWQGDQEEQVDDLRPSRSAAS